MDSDYKIRLIKPNSTSKTSKEGESVLNPLKRNKVFNSNSPIFKKMRDAEERNRELEARAKLSDDELIELEFKEEVDRIRFSRDYKNNQDVKTELIDNSNKNNYDDVASLQYINKIVSEERLKQDEILDEIKETISTNYIPGDSLDYLFQCEDITETRNFYDENNLSYIDNDEIMNYEFASRHHDSSEIESSQLTHKPNKKPIPILSRVELPRTRLDNETKSTRNLMNEEQGDVSNIILSKRQDSNLDSFNSQNPQSSYHISNDSYNTAQGGKVQLKETTNQQRLHNKSSNDMLEGRESNYNMHKITHSALQTSYSLSKETAQNTFDNTNNIFEAEVFGRELSNNELDCMIEPSDEKFVKDNFSLYNHSANADSKIEIDRVFDIKSSDNIIKEGFSLPSTHLLNPPNIKKIDIDDSEIDLKVHNLFSKLKVFKIDGDIVRTYSGPVVTTFEFRPAPNVKVSRIQNLQDDLSMALKATSIRIQAPIPGKDVVGIEIPNNKIQTIYLREIFESDEFINSKANLAIVLGKDVIGNPVVEDLSLLPHLLIAGTTGSGKSVGINAMILSLLYKNTPKDLRLMMIDPKFLEFGLYEDIPHLLTPIITNPKKAIIALSKVVDEMNRRYEMMNKYRVKTIVGYNEMANAQGLDKLPYIVIIIDEFADLMIMGGKEAEQYLISLAGKARASGIHLIIATQRPTVNVVTGLIKGNLPSKISYRVGTKLDSKVILDESGAESLLGKGDMLFSKTNTLVRIHAPYNDEKEIERVVEFIKSQQAVEYDEFFSLEAKDTPTQIIPTQIINDGDYKERAKEIILQSNKTSISYLQRSLGVGFNKAASIVEQLEKEGFLSAPNSKGIREILG